MGAGQSDEQIKKDLLRYLENDEEYVVPGSNAKSIGKELLQRLKIGAQILKKPTPTGILKPVAKAVANQGQLYTGNIKNNTLLRKQRKILNELVDEKIARKARATGRSADDLKKEMADMGENLKWDKQDWLNLAYGGPWGAIASGVRHKRQNDVNRLMAQYRKLKSEGYGKYAFLKNKKKREYTGPMTERLKRMVMRAIT